MKKSLVFLVLSLAANAAFIVTYAVRSRAATESAALDNGSKSSQSSTASASRDAKGSPDDRALKRAGELLAAQEGSSLVARLRAAGFPPSMIRAIVAAQVTERFRDRTNALLASQNASQFWKNNAGTFANQKDAMAYNALMREQAAEVRKLLGDEAMDDNDMKKLSYQRMYGNLPQAKIDQIESANRDYAEMREQLMADSKGVFLAEDRDKMALLDRERRADIEKLLSPAELAEYDLRNSNLSYRLRFQLAGFNPTEEEFRTIFRLSQAADPSSVNGGNIFAAGGASADQRAAMQAAQAQLKLDIAAALGADRAAEYEISTNPAYQEINRLLTRLDLPPTIAPQVLAVQKDIQDRANFIRRDRGLDDAGRREQLASLNQEAETKLTAALGQKGFAAYKSYGSGGWLNSLTPRPGNMAMPIPQPAMRLPGGGG